MSFGPDAVKPSCIGKGTQITLLCFWSFFQLILLFTMMLFFCNDKIKVSLRGIFTVSSLSELHVQLIFNIYIFQKSAKEK